MTTRSRHAGIGHAIRERDGASLERVTPKRPARDHQLLLAPEPILNYLQELLSQLRINLKVTCIPCGSLQELPTLCRQWLDQGGPFMRIYVIVEWDGQDETSVRHAWHAFEESLLIRTRTQPRLLVCRPSFLLWILLHFEDVAAETDNAGWLQQRVEELLKQVVPKTRSTTLFARTRCRLAQALRRAQQMSWVRQNSNAEDLWPKEPGTHLHELLIYWYRLARQPLPDES
ncbi:MAG: hypothetical protein H7834_07600 [Magnetococcus sp. YQC-9]